MIGFFRRLGRGVDKLWRGLPVSVRMVIRNIAGVIVIFVGLVLSLPGVPGPGIMTIVAGFLLLDFPQKRALLRRLQHSWLIQKLLKSAVFAKFWRQFRRQAKNSENTAGGNSIPD